MRLIGTLIALVLVLAGVVWTLQGSNVIGGSVMSGHPQWVYIGILMTIVGLVGLWWFNARRRPAR